MSLMAGLSLSLPILHYAYDEDCRFRLERLRSTVGMYVVRRDAISIHLRRVFDTKDWLWILTLSPSFKPCCVRICSMCVWLFQREDNAKALKASSTFSRKAIFNIRSHSELTLMSSWAQTVPPVLVRNLRRHTVLLSDRVKKTPRAMPESRFMELNDGSTK